MLTVTMDLTRSERARKLDAEMARERENLRVFVALLSVAGPNLRPAVEVGVDAIRAQLRDLDSERMRAQLV